MNTYEYAQLCQYVYHHTPDGEAHEIEWFISRAQPDVVALRGTGKDLEDDQILGMLQDIWTDIRFCPWYNREIGGWHPVGFLRAGVAVADKLEGRGIKHITGHSLGGAVAQIAGAVLAARGEGIESVIVFGSPRVGRLDPLDDVKVELYISSRDLIDNLPPWLDAIREGVDVATDGHALYKYIDELYWRREE